MITKADGKAEGGSFYAALKNPRSVRDYGQRREAERYAAGAKARERRLREMEEG